MRLTRSPGRRRLVWRSALPAPHQCEPWVQWWFGASRNRCVATWGGGYVDWLTISRDLYRSVQVTTGCLYRCQQLAKRGEVVGFRISVTLWGYLCVFHQVSRLSSVRASSNTSARRVASASYGSWRSSSGASHSLHPKMPPGPRWQEPSAPWWYILTS